MNDTTDAKNTTDTIERRAEDMRRRLREIEVAILTVEYDGYADSGAIEDVLAHADDDTPVKLPSAIRSKLIELFYDLLEERFYGWENETGAFGRFEWDLRTNAMRQTHNARYDAYDTTERYGWSVPGEEGA